MTPEFCVMMLESVRNKVRISQADFARCLKVHPLTYAKWVWDPSTFNPHTATWECILRAIDGVEGDFPCHLCRSYDYCVDDAGGQLPMPPDDCPRFTLIDGMIDRRPK